MPNLRLSSIGLLTVLVQFSPSFAQSNSTNGTSECLNTDLIDELSSEYATVNSTGKTSFRWTTRTPTLRPEDEDPWYLSVTINDTSREPNTSSVDRRNYISIPNDVKYDGVCVYQFEGINATATGTGNNGCEGVISDTCLDYMRKAMLRNGVGSAHCPLPPSALSNKDEREEECGHLIKQIVSTAKPFNASNQTCTLTKVPGVTLPDNYHSKMLGGHGSPFANYSSSVEELPTYDLLVRQVVPFFVTASVRITGGTITDGDVVCVTPGDVQPGSRVPESEEPWETSAAGSNWQSSRLSATLLAGVVTAILAL